MGQVAAKRIKVSFVIPCYRSEKTLPSVIDEIRKTMEELERYDYEVVLVNDCSPDGTFEVIRELAKKDPAIHGINLARNFGQHAALMAGFRHANGDVVVCLDDDGQTPACEVGKLLDEIEAGSDVVYAKYRQKKHSAFRNFGSRVNERMLRTMLDKPADLYVSSYFAAKRFVVDEMIRYRNSYPYVIGLVLRTTKKITNVEVSHREREVGSSGYTLKKLLGLWMNGFTAFSVKPLRLATGTGCVIACAGFLYGVITVIRKLVGINTILGFSALMSMMTFLGGLILIMLGVIGEYIGRIYISINDSPQYVIREVVEQESSDPEIAGIVTGGSGYEAK